MSHELDRLLVQALADEYPDQSTARRILEDAEIPRLGMIAWTPRPLDTWHSALRHVRRQGKILGLLECVLGESPENGVFQAARHEELQKSAATRPSAVGWRREVPGKDLEKLMGSQSTLLPISFLNVGLQRAKAVARVLCQDGSVATGFLISNDLFVTNHHVLSSPTDADGATAEFAYDHEPGKEEFTPPVVVRFRPSRGFVTSAIYDCTVVRTEDGANSNWGAVPVNPPKIKDVAWVNIIQHADGRSKSIALYHNVVAYADVDVVQYYTDTLPGSSGSPVFDSSWRLVAVHRAGGHLYEPGGDRWVYRNEGLNAVRLVELLSDIQ